MPNHTQRQFIGIFGMSCFLLNWRTFELGDDESTMAEMTDDELMAASMALLDMDAGIAPPPPPGPPPPEDEEETMQNIVEVAEGEEAFFGLIPDHIPPDHYQNCYNWAIVYNGGVAFRTAAKWGSKSAGTMTFFFIAIISVTELGFVRQRTGLGDCPEGYHRKTRMGRQLFLH